MTYRYNIARREDGHADVTVIVNDGTVLLASDEHPSYERIVEALIRGDHTDDGIRKLFDPSFEPSPNGPMVTLNPRFVSEDGDDDESMTEVLSKVKRILGR